MIVLICFPLLETLVIFLIALHGERAAYPRLLRLSLGLIIYCVLAQDYRFLHDHDVVFWYF